MPAHLVRVRDRARVRMRVRVRIRVRVRVIASRGWADAGAPSPRSTRSEPASLARGWAEGARRSERPPARFGR